MCVLCVRLSLAAPVSAVRVHSGAGGGRGQSFSFCAGRATTRRARWRRTAFCVPPAAAAAPQARNCAAFESEPPPLPAPKFGSRSMRAPVQTVPFCAADRQPPEVQRLLLRSFAGIGAPASCSSCSAARPHGAPLALATRQLLRPPHSPAARGRPALPASRARRFRAVGEAEFCE